VQQFSPTIEQNQSKQHNLDVKKKNTHLLQIAASIARSPAISVNLNPPTTLRKMAWKDMM